MNSWGKDKSFQDMISQNFNKETNIFFDKTNFLIQLKKVIQKFNEQYLNYLIAWVYFIFFHLKFRKQHIPRYKNWIIKL